MPLDPTSEDEKLVHRVSLALVLTDAFTRQKESSGELEARLAFLTDEAPETLRARYAPIRKEPAPTFVFTELLPGDYTVQVRSNRARRDGLPAYYAPLDVPFSVPGAPVQRRFLRPAVAYPFPPGAALVRGVVTLGEAPLPGATVRRTGHPQTYRTGDDGQFVLFFRNVSGLRLGREITLSATHPDHASPPEQTVTVVRGATTSLFFQFT